MRWLITGATGQLGHHLLAQFSGHDDVVVGLGRADLDVTDAAAVDSAVAEHRPDVLVNAAAYTNVDGAESDEAAALLANAVAPTNLAVALQRHGGRLVHVSTDYVFGGDSTEPYEPTDAPEPRTAYGRTKLAGEEAVLQELPDRSWVVRTAWVYGGPGPNFVDTMRRLSSERPTVDVVDDQLGSPTWAADIAAALVELGRSQAEPGVLHYTNAGQASWYELARAVFAEIGADPERVHPTTSAAFVRPAPRPAWSVLSTASWTNRGLTAPRPWREALHEAIGQD